MCPIETPEGPNIGLIGALSTYARVNEFGFIETPVPQGRERQGHRRDRLHGRRRGGELRRRPGEHAAQRRRQLPGRPRPRAPVAAGREPRGPASACSRPRASSAPPPTSATCRRTRSTSWTCRRSRSSRSATALIPFLEHDDANRALMGANMQRQAVPLVRAEAPYIGTGIEDRAARDAADLIQADRRRAGHSRSRGDSITVAVQDARARRSTAWPSSAGRTRTPASTSGRACVEGEKVTKGDVLADGPVAPTTASSPSARTCSWR